VCLLSSIRILVADDHKDWRNQVRLLLQARPEWQVISEVSDGEEAVRKTEELKPDLILLDIDLPRLNGIEAARQIRQLSPDSKIVFLSMENSLDVVQGALSTGAQGYVYKARARRELLSAIDAVLSGQQFVTSLLKGHRFSNSGRTKVPHHHGVQFYSDDALFLDNSTRYIAAALGAGDVVLSVTTEFHRHGVIQSLKTQGFDVDAAIRQGTYFPVDVAKMLSTFMVNDMPDSVRFLEVVGAFVRAAAKAGKREHPRVAVCEECAPLLWQGGKVDAAIRLEQLLNELTRLYDVDILCGYALSGFRGEQGQRVLESICAEHSNVHFQGNR
jgi:DNA-binding NarL/FixJ family response regulator